MSKFADLGEHVEAELLEKEEAEEEEEEVECEVEEEEEEEVDEEGEEAEEGAGDEGEDDPEFAERPPEISEIASGREKALQEASGPWPGGQMVDGSQRTRGLRSKLSRPPRRGPTDASSM